MKTCVVTVKVEPSANKNRVDGWQPPDSIAIRVKARAANGAANAAVIRTLAHHIGLRESDVTIVAGAARRTKRIRVKGCDLDELRSLMNRSDN